MPTIKISELPSSATPLSGHETIIMNQNGITVTAILSSVKSYTGGGGVDASTNYAILSANNRFTGSITTMNGLSSTSLSSNILTLTQDSSPFEPSINLNGIVGSYGGGIEADLGFPVRINGSIYWILLTTAFPL